MKLRHAIPYVSWVRTTLEFYRRAFGAEIGFVHESGDYGELSTGDTKLAFSSLDLMEALGKDPGKADSAAPVFEIAFETMDVEGALGRAKEAGANIVQPARRKRWRQTTGYVADLNGFLVEVCSPVEGFSGDSDKTKG